MMQRRIGQFLASFLFLIALIVFINYAIHFNLILPKSVNALIVSSDKPDLARWVLSGLMASTIITLLKIGLGIGFLNNFLDREHPLFTFVLKDSLWIALPVTIFTMIFLWTLLPAPPYSYGYTTPVVVSPTHISTQALQPTVQPIVVSTPEAPEITAARIQTGGTIIVGIMSLLSTMLSGYAVIQAAKITAQAQKK